jgi:hypothetical protein
MCRARLSKAISTIIDQATGATVTHNAARSPSEACVGEWTATSRVRLSPGVLHTKVIVAPNSLGAPSDGTIPATIAGPINGTVIAKNTLTPVAPSSSAAVGRRLVHSMAKAWPQAPGDDTVSVPLLRKATSMKVRIEYCVP